MVDTNNSSSRFNFGEIQSQVHIKSENVLGLEGHEYLGWLST